MSTVAPPTRGSFNGIKDLAMVARQVRYEQLSFWLNPLGAFFTLGFSTIFLVLLGAIGAGVLAPAALARGAERRLIAASIAAGIGGSVVLALVHLLAVDAVVLSVMGMLLLTDLPVILELSERRAGNDGGTVAALMWMAGNGGGLVVAVLVQALVHDPVPAFLLLAACGCTALPLLAGVSGLPVPAQGLPGGGLGPGAGRDAIVPETGPPARL